MTPITINAVAPTRVCDVGGWTDTHFARHGAVVNIAIYPFVEVQVTVGNAAEAQDRIVIEAENFGESFAVDPAATDYDKHPLLEAAVRTMQIPDDVSLRINIFSHSPPGASMGTSAAVSVALIGALSALAHKHLTPHEAAGLAHALETEELGLECGIQDQLASAYGGINFIEMAQYPHASISQIPVDRPVLWEIERRLVVAYIGTSHRSSDIHKRVIAGLGDRPHEDERLQRLRELARSAKDALCEGDLRALGRTFDENTAVQRRLHPDLVCEAFEEIIGVAGEFGSLGCKVNGAGGDGGSIAILTDGDMARKRALEQALTRKQYRCLPIHLSRHGLRVWRCPDVPAGA